MFGLKPELARRRQAHNGAIKWDMLLLAPMKFFAEMGGRNRVVEIETHQEGLHLAVDGVPLEADAVEVEPGVYSILWHWRSFQVKVEEIGGQLQVYIVGRSEPYRVALRDPRQWRRSSALGEGEGSQEVSSPMPGKVVRLLVEEQQTVAAGQGLLVVEAMKMQNEVRSPRAGVVTQILAHAGATVHAGQTLAVVE